MVSQAGAGDSVGALVYGLPHLALPQTAQSQISVADRIHDLGVGRRLAAHQQTTDAILCRQTSVASVLQNRSISSSLL